MKNKQQHTHKYERVILSKRSKSNVPTKEDYVVYKCTLPGCAHYIERKLVKGRKSICWRCGDEFVLKIKHLRLKRPVCCTNENKIINKDKNNATKPENLLDFIDTIVPRG